MRVAEFIFKNIFLWNHINYVKNKIDFIRKIIDVFNDYLYRTAHAFKKINEDEH